jgi:hypothetical protein
MSRVLGQEGPWLISVARSPYCADIFCLYIKSKSLFFFSPKMVEIKIIASTHNRILIRERNEIMNLDSEIRRIYPQLVNVLPTLSFLDPNKTADPNPKPIHRTHTIRDLFNILSLFSPPAPSMLNNNTTNSNVIMATYFSALSENEFARSSKIWRHFAQVRKDDLELNWPW